MRIQRETAHKDFIRNLVNRVLHIIIMVMYSMATEYELDEAINSPTHGGETKSCPIKDVTLRGLSHLSDPSNIRWTGSLSSEKEAFN